MGEYPTTNSENNAEEFDIFYMISLAKRQNFSFSELKEISFVTLLNILFSSVDKNEETEATQNDIDAFF